MSSELFRSAAKDGPMRGKEYETRTGPDKNGGKAAKPSRRIRLLSQPVSLLPP